MRLPINLIAKPGSLLLSMATALSWIVVLVFFLQVAASTIMWLLIRFGIIVFSPWPEFSSSGQISVFITAWALLLGLGIIAWSKYNRRRYFNRNRRLLKGLPRDATLLTWSEAFLDFTKTPAADSALYLVEFSAPAYNLLQPEDTLPAPILSAAAVLNRKNNFKQAASLARLVLTHPQATPLLKKWPGVNCKQR